MRSTAATLRLQIGARLLEAVHPDQLLIEVVDVGGEVRAGARGHAAAERSAVEHDDRLACAGKLIGGREAGDAGADDHDIGFDVALSEASPTARGPCPSRAIRCVRRWHSSRHPPRNRSERTRPASGSEGDSRFENSLDRRKRIVSEVGQRVAHPPQREKPRPRPSRRCARPCRHAHAGRRSSRRCRERRA